MPLINPSPSAQDRLRAQAQGIRGELNREYRQLVALNQKTSAFVWANTDATPQQIFDAFGTDAGDLVRLSGAFLSFISAATGQTLPSPVPAGTTLTVNPDGTVVVKAS